MLTSGPVVPDSQIPIPAAWRQPPESRMKAWSQATERARYSLPHHVARLPLASALLLQSRLLLYNPGKTCVLSGTGTVRPVPGNPWVQVWLKGAAAETTFGRTLWFRGEDRFEHDARGGIRPIGGKLTVDLPEQHARTWKHVVTIPAGRACLVGAFPDPKEPARLRIMVVEARVGMTP